MLSGEETRELARVSGITVDEQIEITARRRLSDVVQVAEGGRPYVGSSANGKQNMAAFLVSRLFTDAIFNQDIRTIQLIINRIDGGLPKDSEMDGYRTLFSDCFNEIMQMDHAEQIKLLPDDTVMMALCKSLYQLSVQDIYYDSEHHRQRKPSVEKKQERDSALRMVLERTGGRKTIPVQSKQLEVNEDADWLKELSLPSGQ